MMRLLKIKRHISSLCVALLITCCLIQKASARDCDPFSLDPNDPNACDGGDPDNAPLPLDSNIIFLVVAGAVMILIRKKKSTA